MGLLQEVLELGGSRLTISKLLVDVTRIGALVLVLLAAQSVYRLYIHPLRRFSGTRLAAISPWWLYLRGIERRPEEVFEKLHKKHNSSVIRIGPNELHINDPEIYPALYSQTTRFLKHPHFYAGFNAPATAFTEDNPVLHKERRKLIQNNFSQKTVHNASHLIFATFDILDETLRRLGSKDPVNIHNALRSVTVDIISELSFGDSFQLLQAVKDSNFENPFLEAFDLVATSVLHFEFWPMIRKLTNIIPHGVALRMSSQMAGFISLNNACPSRRIQLARHRFFESGIEHKADSDQPVIFHQLRDLSEQQSAAEAIDIMVAGSDTTATTLTLGIHQIIAHPEISRKLVEELRRAIPLSEEMPTLKYLEDFEYLTACAKEALRFAMAVPGRLPRVVPPTGSFIVEGKLVPPGTVVGMSAHSMHLNRDIWGANARDFAPERWLQPDSGELEKYLVSFSKGARMCLGINLAYAEIRIALANLFRRFDMTLDSETSAAELERMDCFTTSLKGGGPKVYFKALSD